MEGEALPLGSDLPGRVWLQTDPMGSWEPSTERSLDPAGIEGSQRGQPQPPQLHQALWSLGPEDTVGSQAWCWTNVPQPMKELRGLVGPHSVPVEVLRWDRVERGAQPMRPHSSHWSPCQPGDPLGARPGPSCPSCILSHPTVENMWARIPTCLDQRGS